MESATVKTQNEIKYKNDEVTIRIWKIVNIRELPQNKKRGWFRMKRS